jgi:hypothetical protein
MAALYEEGWHQGTIFEAALPLDAVVLSEASGRPERRTGTHGRWVIATQDCDLDQIEITDPEPTIELRPVYTDDPPPDWGLRSAKLRLTDEEFVKSASPRTLVSAAVLTALKAEGVATYEPAFSRRRAFTIWLGKRYDRPAVPPQLVSLAREIANKVTARRNRPRGARVRDVLMQFDEAGNPTRFSLFAVLENEADEHDARSWLSEVALEIPSDLGVADRIEAATASGISLQLIEDSYSADVSQVTWRPNNPDPQGAA